MAACQPEEAFTTTPSSGNPDAQLQNPVKAWPRPARQWVEEADEMNSALPARGHQLESGFYLRSDQPAALLRTKAKLLDMLPKPCSLRNQGTDHQNFLLKTPEFTG